MKVRIVRITRPEYRIAPVTGNKGRLAELDDNGSHITQDILKKLFDAGCPPSTEPKHDRFEEATRIESLRDMGCTWVEIGAEMGKSAHAAQSLYQRYFKKKCPMCQQCTMKKVKAKPEDRHLTPYWWECTNDRCNEGGERGGTVDEGNTGFQGTTQQDEDKMPRVRQRKGTQAV